MRCRCLFENIIKDKLHTKMNIHEQKSLIGICFPPLVKEYAVNITLKKYLLKYVDENRVIKQNSLNLLT